MRKIDNIEGKRFGRLTTIGFAIRRGNNFYWKFKCDCGKQCLKQIYDVIRGTAVDCGCITRHGMSRTKFYKTWLNLKRRCSDPNLDSYPFYGGRGISFDPKWKFFENFKKEMYESYCEHAEKIGEKNISIERFNPDGDYCRENCTWTTQKWQCRNRRTTKLVEYNGVKRSLPEWSEILGIDYNRLRRRIFGDKWPIEKAFNSKKFVNQFG